MSKESPNTLVLTKMYINENIKLKESKSNNTHKITKGCIKELKFNETFHHRASCRKTNMANIII